MEKKKYIVNEHQFRIIAENIVNETPDDFVKGDQIILLEPVEGYNVPPEKVGTVIHVDAIGTVRTEFEVNGQIIVVPIDPEVDQIRKITQPFNLMEEKSDTYIMWNTTRTAEWTELLNQLNQTKGRRYILKWVYRGKKWYLCDTGTREEKFQYAPAEWTANPQKAVSSDDSTIIFRLAHIFIDKINNQYERNQSQIEIVDRQNSNHQIVNQRQSYK